MATTSRTPHRILLASVGLVAVLGVGAVAYGATATTPADAAAPVASVAATGTDTPDVEPAALTGDVAEADSIAFMAEEEKLARDVYLTLGDMWDARIFSNIANAEQMHMDAVLQLADTRGLADPVGDNPIGVFNDDELQQLYDDLVAAGSASYEAALEVGAVVEEVDIEDLVAYLDGPTSPDVAAVYERLLSGSENHLRAFAGQLDAAGVDRTPVALDPGTTRASSPTPRGTVPGTGRDTEDRVGREVREARATGTGRDRAEVAGRTPEPSISEQRGAGSDAGVRAFRGRGRRSLRGRRGRRRSAADPGVRGARRSR